MKKYREETKAFAKSEEDVLSCALFPQVAPKFIEKRDHPVQKEEPKPDNGPRVLYVEDLLK